MIALTNIGQTLMVEVFNAAITGGGVDDLHYTVHYAGQARRRVGHSGGSTQTTTRSGGLKAATGKLNFAGLTEILQGSPEIATGAVTVDTLTIYNPGPGTVDVAVQIREEDRTTAIAPLIYRTLWRVWLKPDESFTYADNATPEITPSYTRWGFLSGVAQNTPLLITATTPGTAQTIHTSTNAELVTLKAGSVGAAAQTLGIIIGGVEWQAYVSERTPIVLLEDYLLGVAQTIQVYASVGSEASVWGHVSPVIIQ